jgi:hypothetical protein
LKKPTGMREQEGRRERTDADTWDQDINERSK